MNTIILNLRRMVIRTTLTLLALSLIVSTGVQAIEIQALDLSKELEALSKKHMMSVELVAQDSLEESFAALRGTGIEEKARNRGDRAPNVRLPNALGEIVSLNEALEEGPAVLLFYMGEWCPYCNITLRAYQRPYRRSGANLFAISPENPNNSLSMIEKNNLEFEVLTDRNSKVARKFGISYNMDEALSAISGGMDISEKYDAKRLELPLAATYVIDQDRTIKYAFVNVDYRLRAEPFDVLKVLMALKR